MDNIQHIPSRKPYKFKVMQNDIKHMYCIVPAGVTMSYLNLNELQISGSSTLANCHDRIVFENKMFNGVYLRPCMTSPVYFDTGLLLVTTHTYLLFDKLSMKYYRCIAGYVCSFIYSDTYEMSECANALNNTGATRAYIFAEYDACNKINIFDKMLWFRKFDITHIDNASVRNSAGRVRVLDSSIKKVCNLYNRLPDFKFPYAI